MKQFLKKHIHALYLLLIFSASAAVYMSGYWLPKQFFWDENYHIASAQKYIDGVMYMEPHPPLGKLLIAASEYLSGANREVDKKYFRTTDYIKNEKKPPKLEFYGFRLPSVLLMTFCPLLLFGILRRLVKNIHVALAFTSLIIFDNALVVHTRAAMLEGIQLFFILLSVYYAVVLLTRNKPVRLRDYAYLGFFVALAIMVKVNGAILLLLFPMVYFYDQWEQLKAKQYLLALKRLLSSASISLVSLLLVSASIFYIHIALGGQMVNATKYKPSKEYRELIKNGQSHTLSAFVVGMKDNLKYMSNYADGVPRLDMCKDGENGSPAGIWPLGGKTIKYRWGKTIVDKELKNIYMYLAPNPMVWFSVLLGIVLSISLIVSRFVFGNPVINQPLFLWICCFTGFYLAYMIAVAQIERVMYLYHYFIALVFGMINCALVFSYIFNYEVFINSKHLRVNLAIYVLLIMSVFAFFSPLTYSIPLSETEFSLRNWFNVWMLEPEIAR